MEGQTASTSISPDRRERMILRISWLVWMLFLLGNLVVFIFLFPRKPEDIIRQYTFSISYPAIESWVRQDTFAWFRLVLDYLVVCGFWFPAIILVWKKPRELIALFTSALLIAIGIQFSAVTFSESSYQNVRDFLWLENFQAFISLISSLGLSVYVYIFPDGYFVPARLGRWVSVYVFVMVLGVSVAQVLGYEFFYFFIAAYLFLSVGGIFSQVYRYRQYATPIQKQQVKWVVVGLAAYPLFIGLWLGIVGLLQNELPVVDFVFELLNYFSILLIPLTLTASILRLRLWDIDFVIRRTLVYTLLTTSLIAIYFLLVTVLQFLSTRLFGLNSPVVTVTSTLVIAALFNPFRIRIQSAIDRRFYRQRYNAEKALADFASTIHNEAEIECITQELIDLIQETMQPESVEIQLRSKVKER